MWFWLSSCGCCCPGTCQHHSDVVSASLRHDRRALVSAPQLAQEHPLCFSNPVLVSGTLLAEPGGRSVHLLQYSPLPGGIFSPPPQGRSRRGKSSRSCQLAWPVGRRGLSGKHRSDPACCFSLRGQTAITRGPPRPCLSERRSGPRRSSPGPHAPSLLRSCGCLLIPASRSHVPARAPEDDTSSWSTSRERESAVSRDPGVMPLGPRVLAGWRVCRWVHGLAGSQAVTGVVQQVQRQPCICAAQDGLEMLKEDLVVCWAERPICGLARPADAQWAGRGDQATTVSPPLCPFPSWVCWEVREGGAPGNRA